MTQEERTTLVDPIPPTIRETPKKSKSGCIIVLCISVLSLLGMGGGIYYRFFHYVPHAREHIPAGANVVVRMDLRRLAMFAPFRKHILPLIDLSDDKLKSRVAAIQKETGVSLVRDVREVVVATLDGNKSIVVLGGNISKDKFISGIQVIAKSENLNWQFSEHQVVLPNGWTIAQAEDGSILFGTDVDIVNASYDASNEWSKLGMPWQEDVAIGVTELALSGLSRRFASLTGATSLSDVKSAYGALKLSASPSLSGQMQVSSPEAAKSIREQLELLRTAIALATALSDNAYEMREAIHSLQFEAAASIIQVTGAWSEQGVDLFFQDVAKWIQTLNSI